jgi:hypothetical protein
MTQSRWLAACAAALLLGGAARAQCGPAAGGSCPTPDTARTPSYSEMTPVVYPAQAAIGPCSGPAIWVRLFDAIAQNLSLPPSKPFGKVEVVRVGCEASTHLQVAQLLELYRLYYRLGHYGSAEYIARRLLALDPGNPAADAAMRMAAAAAEKSAHAGSGCGDSDDCEALTGDAQKCGTCAKGRSGCARAASKQCCQGCCKACTAKASCACGAKCTCAKDDPCACGEDCCCKKSQSKAVKHRRLRQGVLVLPNPVPMMVCPPCPFCPACPGVEMTLPHVMNPFLPHPVPGMMPPPAVVPPPSMWHAQGNGYGYPPVPGPVAQPEPLPMPCPVERVLPPTMPTGTAEQPRPQLKFCVVGKQIHLSCPCLDARCDSVSSLPDGRALLEGNVVVNFHTDHQPARIHARSMIVDLEDGTYEVNPPGARKHTVKPVSHQEAPPAPPVKTLGGCKVVPAGCAPVRTPCGPAPRVPSLDDLLLDRQ